MTNLSFPNVASITSEALQLKIRQLLPSQAGFGSDLMAQNVIVPIVDLTASAEGSDVRSDLQTAIAFGSQTAFSAAGATVVIANTPGFYKIIACVVQFNSIGSAKACSFDMSDGATTKTIWGMKTVSAIDAYTSENVEFTVFLAAGESISAFSDSSSTTIEGSSRQIADVNGTLVQPVGFTPS